MTYRSKDNEFISRDMALALANAFEAGLLDTKQAIDFFQLLSLSLELLDILPADYKALIVILASRGSIRQLSEMAIANPANASDSTPRGLSDAEASKYPFLAEALRINRAGVIIRSPLMYAGNKADLIAQLFPRFAFQPTFVDMFGGSGIISVNLESGEQASKTQAVSRYPTNQRVLLFEFTSNLANVHKTMSQIHPEICIMLVEKIIKEYGLKTMDEIPDEFKQVIADKKGKTIKDLDRREVLRLYNREPLRKLASVFRDAELNRLPILGSRSNDQFMRAYYSLMFLVMYIFNHATASIYVNQKGNYTIDAGGIGFVSSRRLLLLLFGYRLYIAGSKAGSTLKPEIQDYMLNRLKMETHLDDLPDSSYLSFYTYPEAFTKNLKLYSEQYGFDREPSFMLNPETIPAIAIFNESSISSRPETSQMLKLVNKHRAESGRILFYADPPYLASSVHYGSGWTEDLEAQLLQTLDHIHSSGNYFALSNVTDNTGLSNFMLKKWLIDHPEFKVKLLDKEYFAQRGTGAASFVTIEVLVTNYDFVDGKPFIELEGDIRAIFDNAGLQYDHFGIGGKTFTKKAFENE